MCKRCDRVSKELKKLIKIANERPTPCLVCQSAQVTCVGWWAPGERHILAAGGKKGEGLLFVFCLCGDHAEVTEENEKKIAQAVIRVSRES